MFPTSQSGQFAGLFSNDKALAHRIEQASAIAGERVWRMPLGAAFDRLIDRQIADMKKIRGKFAGSITAAQFLRCFVDAAVVWAHLDITGMVWADKAG